MATLKWSALFLAPALLVAATATGGSAQSPDGPLAARNGQVVLPYAEQKFRGAVGTTFENSDPAQFPAPPSHTAEAKRSRPPWPT